MQASCYSWTEQAFVPLSGTAAGWGCFAYGAEREASARQKEKGGSEWRGEVPALCHQEPRTMLPESGRAGSPEMQTDGA
ncbi:hypothetical protein NDU88_005627 [Pleurodeles waltl]|uniref:Uncharacterized protein n=1 Tax=Pleurodeles waltl TaxID=8319 RepID=A0AAV7L503_PLEWA|nr:hypothetical protein NDU88_005627 [Pleurodeles waltl]